MTARPAWVNAPNLISLSRIPLAAVFALVDGVYVRFGVLAIAAFTDWADGRLARGRGSVTRAGELLDPIADKTFMVVAVIALVVEGRLPLWTVPLLLLRDIGVAIGALFAFARRPGMRLAARKAGKSVTWLQFAAIGVILLWPRTAIWVAPPIAVLGLIALEDYRRAAVAKWRTRRAGRASGSTPPQI